MMATSRFREVAASGLRPSVSAGEWLLATGLACLLVIAFSALLDPFGAKELWNRPIDHHKYVWMAEHPLTLRTAPFCYRLGVPTLVHFLPLGTRAGFVLVQALAVAGLLVTSFAIARRAGLSTAGATLALLSIAAFGPLMRIALSGYPTVDGVAWLLVGLGLLALLGRNDWLLAAILLLGAVTKESVLFVAPLRYTLFAQHWFDGRSAVRAILVALPAILAFAALRLAWPPLNDDPQYLAEWPTELTYVQSGTSSYAYGELLRTIGRERLADLPSPRFWYDSLLSTFGPLAIAALLAVRLRGEIRAVLLGSWPFVLAVFAQLFVAKAQGRMLVVAAPLVALAAAASLAALADRLRLSAWWLAPVAAIQCAAILLLPAREEAVLSVRETAIVLGVMVAALVIAATVGRLRAVSPAPQ